MSPEARRDSLVIARWYIMVANSCVDRVANADGDFYLERALRACTVVRCVLLQPYLTEAERAQIERDLSDIKKRIEAISVSRSIEPSRIAKASI